MGTWTSALSKKSKNNVDMHVFWKAIAWPIGHMLFLYLWLIKSTSKVEVRNAPKDNSGIYVNWHRHLPFLIVHHGEYSRWLMVSRSPYMEPIATWCERSGLQLARGASGQGGTAALSELREALTNGQSIVLAVDGPNGPGFKVKKGCLDLARETGRPIIPVSCSCFRGKEKKRWDRMLVPGFFDRIQVRYGTPIYYDGKSSLELVSQEIERSLNELDPALVSSVQNEH
jgi:lysophospholipid acyltransferase (LPLAT)-like uncharacterized protein